MVAQLWNRMPKPSAVILDSQLVKQTTGHRTFLEAYETNVCRLSCNPSLGQAQTSIMTLQSPMINEWAEHELMRRVRILTQRVQILKFQKNPHDQVAVKAYANRVSKFW